MIFKNIEDIVNIKLRITDIGLNDNNYIIKIAINDYLRLKSSNTARKIGYFAGRTLKECKIKLLDFANKEWAHLDPIDKKWWME